MQIKGPIFSYSNNWEHLIRTHPSSLPPHIGLVSAVISLLCARWKRSRGYLPDILRIPGGHPSPRMERLSMDSIGEKRYKESKWRTRSWMRPPNGSGGSEGAVNWSTIYDRRLRLSVRSSLLDSVFWPLTRAIIALILMNKTFCPWVIYAIDGKLSHEMVHTILRGSEWSKDICFIHSWCVCSWNWIVWIMDHPWTRTSTYDA